MTMQFCRFCFFALAFCACGLPALTPAQQAKVDIFECQVEAATPFLGSVDAAKAVVGAVRAGDATGAARIALGLGADLKELVDAVNECVPEPTPAPAAREPAPEAVKVSARARK
jgi:hypothetical protein